MDISLDGSVAAVGTASRLIEVFDIDHGTFQDYPAHVGKVDKVRFSPKGDIFLSVSGTELLVWKVCAS